MAIKRRPVSCPSYNYVYIISTYNLYYYYYYYKHYYTTAYATIFYLLNTCNMKTTSCKLQVSFYQTEKSVLTFKYKTDY